MREQLPFHRVVALAGGVGGARLVDGLHRVLPAEALTVVVNTGDDFDHWGLRICPDLDTVVYTLAGLAPADRGWGIDGDTFAVLDYVRQLGGQSWFQLGDRDLATHLTRTSLLQAGVRLTSVTATLCRRFGVPTSILPMSDAPLSTKIRTTDGEVIDFQRWLVDLRAAPEVQRVSFDGSAEPSPEVVAALTEAELIVICPSNPYVSIDPILSLPGVRKLVAAKPTVGVSPIIGGKAVKGPLAAMLATIEGATPSAEAVARHYGDLLNGFVVAPGDAYATETPLMETDIFIPSAQERVRLAGTLLAFAAEVV